MSGLFGGLLKPGDAAELMLKRELERRRDAWTLPGYAYRGAGDYLLQHGRIYRGRERPSQYERGAPNECFWNAADAAEQYPELRYCEGVYTTSNSHPTPHAWCVDADDLVVELTFPTEPEARENGVDGKGMPLMPTEHWIYSGVIFRPELVRWHEEVIGEVCMFDRPSADADSPGSRWLDVDQDHDFPILKVPYDPDRTSL